MSKHNYSRRDIMYMPILQSSKGRGRSKRSKRGGRAALALPEMEEPEMMYDDAMEYESFSSGDSSSEKLKKKKNSRVVRSHFPETWLFQLEHVDGKGKAVVSLKVIIIIQVVLIVVNPLSPHHRHVCPSRRLTRSLRGLARPSA